MATVLVAIVAGFLVAFFSLTQHVRVAATTYDIGRLETDRGRLENRILDLESDLNRLGRAPAIRKLAVDGGLVQLVEPVVVPAR